MPLVDMPLEQLKSYEGRNPRPEDHDAYWARALAEMAVVDSDVQLVPHAMNAPYAECFDLYFTGVRGARIHAKYVQPAASAGKHAAGKHPAVLLFHGYTMSSGDWSDKLKWAARGISVAALDCRGQGGLSEDIGGVKGTTHRGHVDVQHPAPRVRARTLMAVGLMDEICPPSTQFAAYNRMTCPKSLVIYPDFAHENLPGVDEIVYELLAAP